MKLRKGTAVEKIPQLLFESKNSTPSPVTMAHFDMLMFSVPVDALSKPTIVFFEDRFWQTSAKSAGKVDLHFVLLFRSGQTYVLRVDTLPHTAQKKFDGDCSVSQQKL